MGPSQVFCGRSWEIVGYWASVTFIRDLAKPHQPNQGSSPAISKLVNYSRRQLPYLEPWSCPKRVEPETTNLVPGVLSTKPSRQEKFSLPRTVVAKFWCYGPLHQTRGSHGSPHIGPLVFVRTIWVPGEYETVQHLSCFSVMSSNMKSSENICNSV